MAKHLSDQGNDSGKFLLLARAAGIHQNEALASVTDQGQNVSERALVHKALEFSVGYLKNRANYVELSEALTSVLPQGQWKQAAQLVAEDMKVWTGQKFRTNEDFIFRQHLGELEKIDSGQSPLLAICHSTALWRYNYQQALGNLQAPAPEKEFARALSLATEASDVRTLNDCLRICRDQGQQAAMEHLRQAARLEPPKPWFEAMAPIGEPDPPGRVW